MKTIEMKVTGMHCKSCEMLISDALEDINGVEEVNVSYKDGCAIVNFNEEEVHEFHLKSKIRDEGYGVENDC
jgi:copper chaperone CopZ